MNINNTKKKIKFIGSEEYINKNTGEIIKCNVTRIEEKDFNFHKIWLGHVIQTLDIIGNQKIKVLNFILTNINKENQLIMTQRKIAEKSLVSINTVTDTLKSLQNSNFLIKINSGAYQINPDIIFKGGSKDRMNILYQYISTKKE